MVSFEIAPGYEFGQRLDFQKLLTLLRSWIEAA